MFAVRCEGSVLNHISTRCHPLSAPFTTRPRSKPSVWERLAPAGLLSSTPTARTWPASRYQVLGWTVTC